MIRTIRDLKKALDREGVEYQEVEARVKFQWRAQPFSWAQRDWGAGSSPNDRTYGVQKERQLKVPALKVGGKTYRLKTMERRGGLGEKRNAVVLRDLEAVFRSILADQAGGKVPEKVDDFGVPEGGA